MSNLRNQLLASIEQLQEPPRTLARVLGEIERAESAWADSWHDAERESVVLDKLCALRAEARALIEQQLGVGWTLIVEAQL